MGFYSGNSGSIQFGAWDGNPDSEDFEDTSVKITSWTLNTTVQLLETTCLSDWDKTSEYGVRSSTGTLNLLYYSEGDPQESKPSNNAASWLISSITWAKTNQGPNLVYQDQGEFEQSRSAIPVRLRLYLRKVTETYRDFVDLEARITSVSYGSTVNEVTSVEVSFESSGQMRRNAV